MTAEPKHCVRRNGLNKATVAMKVKKEENKQGTGNQARQTVYVPLALVNVFGWRAFERKSIDSC